MLVESFTPSFKNLTIAEMLALSPFIFQFPPTKNFLEEAMVLLSMLLVELS